MPHTDTARIRNVAVVGHRGAGKTTLVEAILHAGGVTGRRGTVADGTTVTDADEDERRRGRSLRTGAATLTIDGRDVTLLDTPGEPSFVGEALAAIHVCEGALVVVNGAAGVEVQTERLWERAAAERRARLIVVTHLDDRRASFADCVAGLREAFGPGVVPIQLPIGGGDAGEVRGIVDLVDMHATFDDVREGEIPDDVRAEAAAAHDALVDLVAEADDALIERVLEGEELPRAEVLAALKTGVLEGRLFPVACAVGTTGVGASPLLELLVKTCPSPRRRGAQHGVPPDDHAPVLASCARVVADPFLGRVVWLKLWSGTLTPGASLTVARTGGRERIGSLLAYEGKDSHGRAEAGAGELIAVPKLGDVVAGDVLAAEGLPAEVVPEIPAAVLPEPLISFAVTPHSKADDDRMPAALRRLAEEDPTLEVGRDDRTGETILSAQSQLHAEVALERAAARYRCHLELHRPRVPYLETIRGTARAQGRHKKQSGGRGQFADCTITVRPLGRGEGLRFVDKIVGGAIPRQYLPAVEKGCRQAADAGIDGHGMPVVDVEVTCVDGKHHAVDSSEMAFALAGQAALREACRAAGTVLLEPVMAVRATVPEECQGDVMGDLTRRRGRLRGAEPSRQRTVVVVADVPLAELLDYAPDLTAMTGGRGEYHMEFGGYEELPAHLADQTRAAVADPADEPVAVA